MASKNKPKPETSLGLFGATIEPVAVVANELGPSDVVDLEDSDDYDDGAIAESGLVRAELLDQAKEITISVEIREGRYEISRTMPDGVSFARMMFTREELVDLIERAKCAMG